MPCALKAPMVPKMEPAKGPSRPFAMGNARVAIPITVPLRVGNHCPTSRPKVKVAYRTEVTFIRE